MDHAATLRSILMNDAVRWGALGLIMALELPDCWIAAGFVRNAVWDHLHGRPAEPPAGDVDVIWFDPQRVQPGADAVVEARLRLLDPRLKWSVKNQARMHVRNGDPPYADCVAAMRCWPETATAVGVRRTGPADYEIAAPFGLGDLFALLVRPTPLFMGARQSTYRERIRKKGWLDVWPRLRVGAAARC